MIENGGDSNLSQKWKIYHLSIKVSMGVYIGDPKL
jgi:hypothetical protein